MASNPSKPPSSVSPAFSLGSIIYVLFKHKWKIVLTTLLALGSAALYYFQTAPPYISEAKLLVIYIKNSNAFDNFERTAPTSESRGNDNDIKSEVEIITSWDLAKAVVAQMQQDTVAASVQGADNPPAPTPPVDPSVPASDTPLDTPSPEVQAVDPKTAEAVAAGKAAAARSIFERFLKSIPPEQNAVSVVSSNLTATSDKGGSVLRVTYQHQDPEVATRVLEKIVQQYFIDHREARRSAHSLEIIKTKKMESSTRLGNTDNSLRKWKNNSSRPVTELTAIYEEELTKATAELEAAKVSLAEQTAWVNEVQQFMSGASASAKPDGNNPDSPEAKKEAAPTGPAPEADKALIPDRAILAAYQSLMEELAVLKENRNGRLTTRTPQSDEIRAYDSQIAGLEKERLKQEKNYPYLVAPAAAAGSKPGSVIDLSAERGKLVSLGVRVESLKTHVQSIQAKVDALAANASAISKLERERESEQKNFDYLSTSYVKAEADSMVPGNQTPGISVVQEPTPGFRDVKKRNQILLGIAAGGPALGIGLVLLFGLFLNRSVKQPLELEESMHLPLMMSIPWFSRRKRLQASLPMGLTKPTKLLKDSEPNKAPWEQYHFMRPFTEAIRDRLSAHFDAIGLVRKPKLIAVTGYNAGAGTSTLAAGLASSLSETGEGKVLLVDMNGSHGEAHPFFDGNPVVSLTKALRLPPASTLRAPEAGILRIPEAKAHEGLLVARADVPAAGVTSAGLRRIMPELKASDFDYVIFDMPPLGQTKPTATLAGLMDKVLVIVEAEATSRSEVQRGYRDLMDAGADVSMIFNKARFHGPRALVGGV